MSYLDKSFCSSFNCKNKCGRRMTNDERKKLKHLSNIQGWDFPVCYAPFCDADSTHKNMLFQIDLKEM